MILPIINTLFSIFVAYIMYIGISQEKDELHPALKMFAILAMFLAGANFVSLFFNIE